MPRNVEMRDRVGGVFNHVDSLLYPKTHINMVEGLLVNNKFNLNYFPDALKSGLKPAGIVASVMNISQALIYIDDYLSANGLDTASRPGSYCIVSGTSATLTVNTGHTVWGEDGTVGIYYTEGMTILMEPQDWLMYRRYDTTNSLHEWVIVNNTHGLASATAAGLMTAAHFSKLEGIAANANNYSHPTLTARNVDTDGIEVLDTFTSNTEGHITGISKRSLPIVTTSLPGVMSAAMLTKLNGIAENANNYALPIATESILGGVKPSTGLAVDVTGLLTNASPNATHTGDVTGSGALTIANDAVTNGKLANMPQNTIKGRITAGAGDPEDLTASNIRSIINVADGANNYAHPTQTALSIDATDVETIDQITVNTLGHVTAISKQAIRAGSTSVTGIVQLATGTELTTALNSTKVTSPVSVKSMIDFFAGMKRYADLATANAASHPDGTIALITVA